MAKTKLLPVVCLNVVFWLFTASFSALAAEPVFFDTREREIYEYFSRTPEVLTTCEHCGGAMAQQDQTRSPWEPTGLTQACSSGASYTGLDSLEASRRTVTYTCQDCGIDATSTGYQLRWVCYDPEGCSLCGKRRMLQQSEPQAWQLTGECHLCEHEHTIFYNDAEAVRTVEKRFACEGCGATQSRTDTETVWLCTADPAQSQLVSELMQLM